MLGDRHPVGIAQQIGQHRRRPGKRAFSVDHPFAVPQWCQPLCEGGRIGKWSVVTEEAQLAGVMRLVEGFEEVAAE